MFRKLPPGPVNQLNIELNAKKCFVWLFDTLKMRTKFFLWQIIHWYTQTKHTSGLVNVGNIMEIFLSKCIFMNNNFLNLNRKSPASHGECLYMERGKFAQFFQRSACNFESNIAIQSPSLTAIRLESDMKHSPYFGENFRKFFFTKHSAWFVLPNHYTLPPFLQYWTELPDKIHFSFSSATVWQGKTRLGSEAVGS